MSRWHPKSHEARLQGLLEQAEDWASSFARSDLAQCEECQRVVEDLVRTETLLQVSTREEKEALSSEIGEDPLVARLEQMWQRTLPRGRRPLVRRQASWKQRLMAVAAAVVALLGLWQGHQRLEGDPASPRWMGQDRLQMSPVGTSDSFQRFSWDLPAPPQGWFVVRVFAKGDPDQAIAESGHLTGSDWSPDGTQTWPDEIAWTLEVYDGVNPQWIAIHHATAAR